MTNTEYEAACITAAGCYDKFEGEHKLKQIDEHIAQVEKTMATLNEMRREIVNQYNLNKPESCRHRYLADSDRCPDCGELIQ